MAGGTVRATMLMLLMCGCIHFPEREAGVHGCAEPIRHHGVCVEAQPACVAVGVWVRCEGAAACTHILHGQLRSTWGKQALQCNYGKYGKTQRSDVCSKGQARLRIDLRESEEASDVLAETEYIWENRRAMAEEAQLRTAEIKHPKSLVHMHT